MATHIEYSAERELDEALAALLIRIPEFVAFQDIVKVLACFVIRMDDDVSVEGKGEPVMLKKVTPEAYVFLRPKANFILVVDHHWWTESSERVRESLMIRALSRIKVDKTETGFKISTRPWDIVDNFITLRHCGRYNEIWNNAAELINRKLLDVAAAGAAAAGVTSKAKSKTPPVEEPKEKEQPKASVTKAAPKPSPKLSPKPPVTSEAGGSEEPAEEPRRPARRVPLDEPAPAEEPEPED
jgi:hypothetical protein